MMRSFATLRRVDTHESASVSSARTNSTTLLQSAMDWCRMALESSRDYQEAVNDLLCGWCDSVPATVERPWSSSSSRRTDDDTEPISDLDSIPSYPRKLKTTVLFQRHVTSPHDEMDDVFCIVDNEDG